MLDIGAHDRRRRLRTQCQRLVVAVFESVHFLRDDVGVRADAAPEQRRLLEHGRANLTEVVRLEDAARLLFHALPESGCRRQQIARAFDGTNRLDFLARLFSQGCPHR